MFNVGDVVKFKPLYTKDSGEPFTEEARFTVIKVIESEERVYLRYPAGGGIHREEPHRLELVHKGQCLQEKLEIIKHWLGGNEIEVEVDTQCGLRWCTLPDSECIEVFKDYKLRKKLGTVA